MRYLLLIYGDEKAFAGMSPEQPRRDGGVRRSTRPGSSRRAGCAPETRSPTRTRRPRSDRRDGKVLATDGPFAETKEQLGGYYIVECANLDEAIEAAGTLPSLAAGGIGRGQAAHRHVSEAAEVVDRLFRRESGRAVATLIRVLGDFELAEEAVQEAFAIALERWPVDGVPDNPGAWITTTARNRAIDRLRREQRRREKTGRRAAHPRPRITG